MKKPDTVNIEVPRLAFSVQEFCASHHVSRTHFYALAKQGKGPRLMRVGRRFLISAEAAADWRNGIFSGVRYTDLPGAADKPHAMGSTWRTDDMGDADDIKRHVMNEQTGAVVATISLGVGPARAEQEANALAIAQVPDLLEFVRSYLTQYQRKTIKSTDPIKDKSAWHLAHTAKEILKRSSYKPNTAKRRAMELIEKLQGGMS